MFAAIAFIETCRPRRLVRQLAARLDIPGECFQEILCLLEWRQRFRRPRSRAHRLAVTNLYQDRRQRVGSRGRAVDPSRFAAVAWGWGAVDQMAMGDIRELLPVLAIHLRLVGRQSRAVAITPGVIAAFDAAKFIRGNRIIDRVFIVAGQLIADCDAAIIALNVRWVDELNGVFSPDSPRR